MSLQDKIQHMKTDAIQNEYERRQREEELKILWRQGLIKLAQEYYESICTEIAKCISDGKIGLIDGYMDLNGGMPYRYFDSALRNDNPQYHGIYSFCGLGGYDNVTFSPCPDWDVFVKQLESLCSNDGISVAIRLHYKYYTEGLFGIGIKSHIRYAPLDTVMVKPTWRKVVIYYKYVSKK